MAAVEGGIKTFLIADVRGYTRWSDKDVLGFLQQLEVLPRLGPPES